MTAKPEAQASHAVSGDSQNDKGSDVDPGGLTPAPSGGGQTELWLRKDGMGGWEVSSPNDRSAKRFVASVDPAGFASAPSNDGQKSGAA